MVNITRGKAIIYAIAAAITIAVISLVVLYFIWPRNIVVSAFAQSEPRLDGNGADSVWTKATAKNISLSNDQNIEIKSVYTSNKVFFLLKLKTATPNKTEQSWNYDGKTWQKGPECDRAALFFVINDSIPTFKNKGFGIMNFGLKKVDSLMALGIIGPAKQDSKWIEADQQADYWLWGAGITNPWDKAADLFYSINHDYTQSPTTIMPRLETRWDALSTTGIIQANVSLWKDAFAVSEGALPQTSLAYGPAYMYKQGKNFNNDPYPVKADMELIPAGKTFKAGDRLPFIYFSDNDNGLWGASRDDVDAKGVWKNGYWTIELSRKLDTGHNDDIKFSPSKTEDVDYGFGALTRLGDKNINQSVPATLRFSSNGGN